MVGSGDRTADQELVYEAGVVTTELLSNAAQACRSRIALRLDVHHSSIRIAVYDDGPGVPVERQARADDVGGRGLRIVDSLTVALVRGARRSSTLLSRRVQTFSAFAAARGPGGTVSVRKWRFPETGSIPA